MEKIVQILCNGKKMNEAFCHTQKLAPHTHKYTKMKFMTMSTVLAATMLGTSSVLAMKPHPQPHHSPKHPSSYYDDCLNKCTINVYGSQWTEAYVRSTPCNNRPAIGTLYEDDVAYDLGQDKFQCGFWYSEVWVPSIGRVGWVASQFLDCGGNNPVPAAAMASESKPTDATSGY